MWWSYKVLDESSVGTFHTRPHMTLDLVDGYAMVLHDRIRIRIDLAYVA
jgi:hypothetical protein